MGREPFPWLHFKSRRQEAKEQAEYAAWAFPYGSAQQEKIRALLAQLFPREPISVAMVNYLTGREAFLNRYDDYDEGYDPLAVALEELYACATVPKQDITLYMALLAADSRVDEALDYPNVEELRAAAADLTDMLRR